MVVVVVATCLVVVVTFEVVVVELEVVVVVGQIASAPCFRHMRRTLWKHFSDWSVPTTQFRIAFIQHRCARLSCWFEGSPPS
jgi:hypothetical protein